MVIGLRLRPVVMNKAGAHPAALDFIFKCTRVFIVCVNMENGGTTHVVWFG